MNVGRTHNTLGNFPEAEKAFWKAKSLLLQSKDKRRRDSSESDDSDITFVTRVAPQHLKVFVNLGNIMAKDPSRYAEADTLYQEAIRMRSDFKEAYINRGDILIKLNRTEEAIGLYETALRIGMSLLCQSPFSLISLSSSIVLLLISSSFWAAIPKGDEVLQNKEFLSVHLFDPLYHPQGHPVRPEAQTAMPEAQTAMPEAQTSMPEAQTSMPEAQPTRPEAQPTMPED